MPQYSKSDICNTSTQLRHRGWGTPVSVVVASALSCIFTRCSRSTHALIDTAVRTYGMDLFCLQLWTECLPFCYVAGKRGGRDRSYYVWPTLFARTQHGPMLLPKNRKKRSHPNPVPVGPYMECTTIVSPASTPNSVWHRKSRRLKQFY